MDGQQMHVLQRRSLKSEAHVLCRTITRSDLLGHLVPMMSSYDWAHSGVTHLFHNIQVQAQSFAPIACAMLASLHEVCYCTSAAERWRLEPVPRNYGTAPGRLSRQPTICHKRSPFHASCRASAAGQRVPLHVPQQPRHRTGQHHAGLPAAPQPGRPPPARRWYPRPNANFPLWCPAVCM